MKKLIILSIISVITLTAVAGCGRAIDQPFYANDQEVRKEQGLSPETYEEWKARMERTYR